LLRYGIVLQLLLLYYFSSGPEAVLLVPVAAVAYTFFSIVGALHANKVGALSGRILVIIFNLLAITATISLLHPTDGGIKPHEYLFRGIEALGSYSSISYNDLYSLSKSDLPLKRLAAFKFRRQLPERAVVVLYYASPAVSVGTVLIFEKRSGNWQFIDVSNSKMPAAVTETAGQMARLSFSISQAGRLRSIIGSTGRSPLSFTLLTPGSEPVNLTSSSSTGMSAASNQKVPK